MARLPRLVLPGIAHHITQRGNRRERTFFEEADYALYLDLLADAADWAGVEIWSYCLMPNHVHRSSTRALIAGANDHVVRVAPAIERVGGF